PARPGGVCWIALDLPKDGAADAGNVAEAGAKFRHRNRLAYRLDAAQSAVRLPQLCSHRSHVDAVDQRDTNPRCPETAAVERDVTRQCEQSKHSRERDAVPIGPRG